MPKPTAWTVVNVESIPAEIKALPRVLAVGPPGSGKTEVLQSLAQLPNVHIAATITEPALLSGTLKRDALGKGGLL